MTNTSQPMPDYEARIQQALQLLPSSLSDRLLSFGEIITIRRILTGVDR